MRNQTIGETVRSAFEIARKAAVLRNSLANDLPTMTFGRDHAVAYRAYTILNDLTLGFDTLESKIAELPSLEVLMQIAGVGRCTWGSKA